MSDLIKIKYVCDSIGHYARPDVVRLQIDRSAQSVVNEFGAYTGVEMLQHQEADTDDCVNEDKGK